MKIFCLDLKMVMSKELGNFVYGTFHHFWKINKHSDVGCFLLMLLDKMVKDKDELKHSNSQLKSHVNGYVCLDGDPRLL